MKFFKELFSSSTEVIVEEPVPFVPSDVVEAEVKMTENQLIAELHDALDTAPDRLLAQAQEFLAQEVRFDHYKEIIQKSDRLVALGFTASSEVEEAKQYIAERDADEKVRNQLKLDSYNILYYKKNYPFLKFITHKELDRLCEKYGLIYGNVNWYKNTVPDKNLAEIESGQLLMLKDLPDGIVQYHTDYGSQWPAPFSKIKTQLIEKYGKSILTTTDISKVDGFKVDLGDGSSYRVFSQTWAARFFIAAPKDHFKEEMFNTMRKSNSEFGYDMIKTDPIVFKKCRGGILIYSKWGLEASDPILLNPVNN